MRDSIFSVIILSVFSARASAQAPAQTERQPARLDVTSTAFGNNEQIPIEYTCEGVDIAPTLTWSRPPAGTQSVAILAEDPDAPQGTFTHWLVTNIPPTATTTATGLPATAMEARNDRGKVGYAGPCPPAGARHRYVFHVVALDVALPQAMSRADFMAAIRGHVLAMGHLVGVYQTQLNPERPMP